MLALHKATLDDWAGVEREAAAVRGAAQGLVGEFARHDFTGDDMRSLADALFALADNDAQFSHNEQITMALEAITTGLKSAGDVGDRQAQSIDTAMKAVYAAFPSEAAVHQDAFVKALKGLQQAMRR
jgi:hypothetical protein